MIIFIIISIIIGSLIGGLIVYSQPFYQKLPNFNGYNIGFMKRQIGLIVLCYTFIFILPLALSSTIFNILAVKKYAEQVLFFNANSRKKIELLIYGAFSLLVFLVCTGCFTIRSINVLVIKKKALEVVAVRITPFIFDIQTIGLFCLNLFISKPLRKMMFSKNGIDVQSKIALIVSSQQKLNK